MKHLFKEGHFKEKKGKKVLEFESTDAAANIYFDKSLYEVSSTLGLYDFGKLSNTEYYYIFKKYGEEGIIDSNIVETSLKKILQGSLNDVVNHNTSLGISDETLENDVFWDVNNNIIFVKGKENLRQICIELAWLGYERLGLKNRTSSIEKELVLSQDIPLISRTKVFK